MAAEIPSEIILDILSRIPVKSLARMRCVSKLWCEYIDNDQYLKTCHDQRSPDEPLRAVTALENDQRQPFIGVHAIAIESKEGSIAPLLKTESIMSLKFIAKTKSIFDKHIILGSCNGLVYLERQYSSCFFVVNPLRKEHYMLPPNNRLTRTHFAAHGLGFDDSTNTFKTVFFASTQTEEDNQYALLHVLGTNSWRQIISQVPLNPIECSFSRPVFCGGCLHWPANESKILSLDMRTEVFQLIDLPKQDGKLVDGKLVDGKLVDLNGEVGCVYSFGNNFNCLEVWILKQKEWAIHCRLDHKPPLPTYGNITVLGCWNKKGDMLIKSSLPLSSTRWFIYCLKGGLLEEVMLTGDHDDICNYNVNGDDILIYPCSLFSIHGYKFMSGPAVTRSHHAKRDIFNRAIKRLRRSLMPVYLPLYCKPLF